MQDSEPDIAILQEFIESETEYFYNLHKTSTDKEQQDTSQTPQHGNWFDRFLEKHFTSEQIASLPEVRSQTDAVVEAKLDALEVYKIVCLQRKIPAAVPFPNISEDQVAIEVVLTPPSAQLEAVATAIEEIGGTRKLRLASIAYTDEPVADLLKACSGRERRPSEIAISDCLLGERSMDAIFRHHADPAGMELESLSLIRCGVGQTLGNVQSHFANFLKTELPDLAENADIPVALPLFLFVRYSWSLKRLDVSGNLLSLGSMKLLGWALQDSVVDKLVLDDCGLTDATLAPLREALGSRNKTLTDLSLRGNVGITDLGEFCAQVAEHPRLMHLNIEGVMIGNVDTFVKMLFRSVSLLAIHAFGLIGDGATAATAIAKINALNNAQKVGTDIPDDSHEFVFYRVPQLPAFEKWRVAFEGKTLAMDCFSNECYVCGGFLRHDFVYTTSHPRVMNVGLVASFSPGNILDLQRTSSGFIVSLLVPPGKHFYAFCINGDPSKLTISRQEYFVRKEPGMPLSDQFRHAEFLNVFETAIARGSLVKARNASEYATEAAEARLQDSKTLMRRCLDADMKNLNWQEICATKEEAELKKMLTARFHLLNEVFTIFAAKHRHFPILKQSNVARFFELCELVETESLSKRNLGAVDAESEIAQVAAYKGILTRPEVQQIIDQTFTNVDDDTADKELLASLDFQQRLLTELSRLRKEKLAKTIHRPVTRGRFIEIVLRASVFVLAKVRKFKSVSEQFAFICDRIIEPVFIRPPLAPFSRTHLAHPEIVKLITRLIPDSTAHDERSVFRQIFLRFGESQDAFIRFAHSLRLQDKVFTTDDVRAIYALSKIPPEDGLSLENPRLTYQEFIEAFCRLSLVHRMQKTKRVSPIHAAPAAAPAVDSSSIGTSVPTGRWRKAAVVAGEKSDKQIELFAKSVEVFFEFTVSKMRAALNQV